MKRSLPNVILGNWAAKAPSVGAAATAEALEHQEIDAVGAAEVRVRVAGRCCQSLDAVAQELAAVGAAQMCP